MNKYTLAIHGGAGAIPKTIPEDQKKLGGAAHDHTFFHVHNTTQVAK